MADINLSPYSAEQQAMDRRRKMAEAMQQQAASPIEIPTTPGVKISPWQGLAKIFQGYLAGKNLSRSDQEQKDYENRASEEAANFLSKMGQFETVPSEVTTQGMLAQKPMINGAVDLRKGEDRVLPANPPMINGAVDLADNEKFVYPANPSTITGKVDLKESAIPAEAISQARSPSQQVPVLNASFLDPTKPYAYKTPQIRNMLVQYLMQQEAQKQAAAQRALEAQQAIHVGKPGESFFRIGADGKPIIVANTPAIPSFEKVETRDPVTGLTIHKYVNKTELGNLGNVPAPYSGFVKDIAEAQNAPESIKKDPALLNVLGSNINKTGGLPTEKDVVNSQLAEAQARAQLGYQGINLGKTERLVKAKNPLIQSKPLPPTGTQLEIGVVYDTPKGRGRWNGTSFTTVD